jgi:hypothetical protein
MHLFSFMYMNSLLQKSRVRFDFRPRSPFGSEADELGASTQRLLFSQKQTLAEKAAVSA